ACTSSLTGNEGNFQFSYPADDRITDFNKPIAVGAMLDLEVRDVGQRQPVRLSDASTDDPAVLEVMGFGDADLTVQATGEGAALLMVEGTTVNGEALTDSINLLARIPEVHRLNHTCAESDQAVYLNSQRIWIPFEFEMSNGQPVIGYGYYPVSAQGDAQVTLNNSDSGQQFMAFDLGEATGAASLTSDIDGSVLAFDVVAPEDIDDISEPIAFVLEDIDVGDKNDFYVLPKAGEDTVCQAELAKTVVSDTPEICTVSEREPLDPDAYEYGWFSIEGLAEGECRFTVAYPDAGVSKQFAYPIEP
ncbi:MAG: hypothetical protein AAFV53_38665, partial [Myxococcota bacterium]